MKDYRTWLEIDKKAIFENVKKFLNGFSGKQKLMGVVKGNANGYGTVPYAKILQEAGVDWLGLTTAEDALAVLYSNINIPVLILCDIPFSRIKDVLEKDIRLTVYDKYTVKKISEKAVEQGILARVHININTGLNRIGVKPSGFLKLAKIIKELPGIQIEGAFTQFSTTHHFNKEKTAEQLQQFMNLIKRAKETGIDIPLLHVASTPSTLKMPETHLDMVRVGIGLAGLYPSRDYREVVNLKFPLTWKTSVCQVKDVESGEYVGYDNCYKCHKKTSIVTIPVGTADGLSINFAGRCSVLINGEKYKIIAVSMNHTMVDLEGINKGINVGDEVVIMGKQKGNFVDPADIAEKIELDMEEMLCHINPDLPRIYY